MRLTEPPRSSVVLVVPEFPSDIHFFGSKFKEKNAKSIQYDLPGMVHFCVMLASAYTAAMYPNSKSGAYCKIEGDVRDLTLVSLINFIEKYETEKIAMEFGSSGFSFPFKKLRDGLSCKDIGTLKGVLTNALALKRWEVYSGQKYRRLCAGNYCEAKSSYEEVRRRVWRMME